jgi:hypothetical protein
VSHMRVRIRLIDRLRSKPNSAQACLIATAANRQWGGGWSVTHMDVKRTDDNGQEMTWRPSAGAHLVMTLYDWGLPVPVRSVKLVRGRGMPTGVVKPAAAGQKAKKPGAQWKAAGTGVVAGRSRKAKRVAAGVTAAGVLLLVVSGLAWVVLAIAGAVIGVLAAGGCTPARSSPSG